VELRVFEDEQSVAEAAADLIAAEARAAARSRGRFTLAVSGGRTPWVMLQRLANKPVPWEAVHLFQVDERVAPAGDADRNLTHLRSALLERVPLEPGRIHAMPVEARDLEGAALQYARTLAADAGTPAVLDLVHLGLGPDGHTASLVPGSSALEETASDVAVTEPYLGHRRMTLTFPVLDRARRVLWVVTGAGKAGVLQRLQAGDRTIPAGRVERGRALVLADRAAAGTAG
jgi:6-phosphogluconolactonase